MSLLGNQTTSIPVYKKSGNDVYDVLKNIPTTKPSIKTKDVDYMNRLDQLKTSSLNESRYTASDRVGSLANLQSEKLVGIAMEYDQIYKDYEDAVTEYQQRGGDASGVERMGSLIVGKLLQYTETLVQGAVATGAQSQLTKIQDKLAKYGGKLKNTKLFSQLTNTLKGAGKVIGNISEATVGLDILGSTMGAVNLVSGAYNTENHMLPESEAIDIIQDIPIINDLFNAGFEVYANIADAFDVMKGEPTEAEIKGYLKYRIAVDENNLENALKRETDALGLLNAYENTGEDIRTRDINKFKFSSDVFADAGKIIKQNHLDGNTDPTTLYRLSGYNDELTRVLWATISSDTRNFDSLKRFYNSSYSTNKSEVNNIINKYL